MAPSLAWGAQPKTNLKIVVSPVFSLMERDPGPLIDGLKTAISTYVRPVQDQQRQAAWRTLKMSVPETHSLKNNERIATHLKAKYLVHTSVVYSGFLYTARVQLIQMTNKATILDLQSQYYDPNTEAFNRGQSLGQAVVAKLRSRSKAPAKTAPKVRRRRVEATPRRAIRGKTAKKKKLPPHTPASKDVSPQPKRQKQRRPIGFRKLTAFQPEDGLDSFFRPSTWQLAFRTDFVGPKTNNLITHGLELSGGANARTILVYEETPSNSGEANTLDNILITTTDIQSSVGISLKT